MDGCDLSVVIAKGSCWLVGRVLDTKVMLERPTNENRDTDVLAAGLYQ